MTSACNDVVITGLSAISAAGVGAGHLLAALSAGRSCLQRIPEEIMGEGGYLWGKAASFKAADYLPPLKARKLDRGSLLAVVATGLALRDAGIGRGSIDPARIGIVLGCGFGGLANAEEFLRGYYASGVEGLVPMLFPNVVPNASASNASIEYELKGPNVTTVQRFCSAESAFLLAKRFLEEGRADVMLTGGVDEVFPAMLQGLKSMGQLPKGRSGFGEGAGIVVLENDGHARRRNARILAGVGEVRTIGRLAPGHHDEGLDRLVPGPRRPDVVALSGTVTTEREILDCLPEVPRLDTGAIIGHSLAMGGLAMAALVLSLEPGRTGLHLAASPEGPYYAIDVFGASATPPLPHQQ